MADEWTALHTFWNSFGIPAFDQNTVPEELWDETLGKMVPLEFPYITYESSVGDLWSKTPLRASIWYKSMSWKEISEKANEISESIGGGSGVTHDHGRIWVTKESPFAQRMSEPSDEQVRRIILQVGVEFQ